MSKIAEVRSELERIETASHELESLQKTRGELMASLDSVRGLLVKAKSAYDKILAEYAESLVLAQKLNDRGRQLSQITGQPWQGIDLPRQYGYSGNIHPNGPTTKQNSGSLVVHEDLVPAVFGGDVFAILREKRARKGA
ncbi:MAG: hypothetical protein HY878_03910 [Deltaproteobacteria bacterium]|nr:hypothetical protein [Deltaproteobacteria bacterium]